MNKFFCCIFSFVAMALYLSSGTLFAQSTASQSNESALAVSPAIVEHVLDPGEPKTFELSITNITNFPLPIASTVRNFVPLEEVTDTADKTTFDSSEWFQISEPQFILQPLATKSVTVTITPPAKAVPGGHYATMYFQPLIPEEALGPQTANLSARVGVLAFLIVKGDMTQKMSIPAMSIPKTRQLGPVPIALKLANQGTVHLSPNGNIKITDWKGEEAGSIPLPLSVVLPNTIRTYDLKWGERLTFGKFTAVANITYGPEHTAITSEPVTFWVVPWGLISIVGIPLALFTLFTIRTRKRWRHAWQILRGKQTTKTSEKLKQPIDEA